MAYFRVHSLAVASYLARSVLYTCAISGTSGSSGFGSVSMEQIDSKTRSLMISLEHRKMQNANLLRSSTQDSIDHEEYPDKCYRLS